MVLDPQSPSAGYGVLRAVPAGRRVERLVASQLIGHSSSDGEGNGSESRPVQFWRALCLVEIGNFCSLRRHLGVPRAGAIVLDIADRVAEQFPGLRLAVAGRRTLEIMLAAENHGDVDATIEKVRSTLARPFLIDGESYSLQLDFGVGVATAHHDDDVRLAEVAEAALEEAKGGSGPVTFDLQHDEMLFDKASLARDLPRALAAEELFVQYQPKVHIRRQEVASAEALIRWEHPSRGLILPAEFISAAEDGGQIADLTIWTLERVIADQRRLAREGHDFAIFINISGVLLTDADFVDRACKIIGRSDSRIGFEITETAVIRDPDLALKHLKKLAAIGVSLAIDDYGAGLSSLAYLKQLPATELKIDKLFVTQLTSSNRDPLIVRSTIDLAHAMEMEVTAEGVETPAAMALLSVMGCDMVQGYLISRPIGFDAFVAFLEGDAHLAATTRKPPSFGNGEGFWKRA